MTDRNFVVKCRERTGKRRRRIAVDEHQIRLCLVKHRIQSNQRFGRDGCKRLPRLHNV